MTAQECYDVIKGDYVGALGRYRTDDKIKKAMRKAINDNCFEELCAATEEHNAEVAYKAASALKVICANLALTTLGYSVTAFSDTLNGGASFSENSGSFYKHLKKDYALTIACIRLLVDE